MAIEIYLKCKIKHAQMNFIVNKENLLKMQRRTHKNKWGSFFRIISCIWSSKIAICNFFKKANTPNIKYIIEGFESEQHSRKLQK